MITQFNLTEKFNQITEYWTPGIVGQLNGQYVKLAKGKGELIWHSHEGEDELFFVVKGTLKMEFRDKTTYTKPGEVLIIPKGVEHKPSTEDEEVWIMLFEPIATKHTGTVEHEKTVTDLKWL